MMRGKSLLVLALLIFACTGPQGASAQLPKIPRIPTRPKPQPTPAAQPAPAANSQPAPQPAPAANNNTNAQAAAAGADQPALMYDSLQVTAWTNNSYKGSYDVWSWTPRMKFRVWGPVPSGSQLYVTFQKPGGGAAPWMTFDCETQETQKNYWRETECGGRKVEDKSITEVGPVNFSIKMRNELQGTDVTVFSGRMKVARTLSNEHGPKAANKFVYYVDHDWNLPIGYVFYTPDSVYNWDYPSFNVAFWVRGEATGFDPHLYYQGKEIGRVFIGDTQVGKGSCGSVLENATTHFVNEGVPQKAKWARVECNFPMVKRWDKTDGGQGQPNTNEMFKMASNPGEYEFKLLWKNRLARTIKFTVGPDGKLDNGIAPANRLGIDRAVVPVTIIGDHDGTWDRTAWKTEAFYGHPLTGFSAP
jgi:hypothetical protein